MFMPVIKSASNSFLSNARVDFSISFTPLKTQVVEDVWIGNTADQHIHRTAANLKRTAPYQHCTGSKRKKIVVCFSPSVIISATKF